MPECVRIESIGPHIRINDLWFNGHRRKCHDDAARRHRRGARWAARLAVSQAPSVTHDHWRRTGNDEGRPYHFTTAAQLLVDFEAEIERVLAAHGIGGAVIGTSDRAERGDDEDTN